MIELDLMQYKDLLQVEKEGGKTYLFDPLRRKKLVLQPEELVRQLIVQFLILEKGYNKNRIKIEKGLEVNGLKKRCDVLVYDREVNPYLLVECKAPNIRITEGAFRQIATYNLLLQVPFLLVSNGVDTFCCKMDYEKETFEYLSEVPYYPC